MPEQTQSIFCDNLKYLFLLMCKASIFAFECLDQSTRAEHFVIFNIFRSMKREQFFQSYFAFWFNSKNKAGNYSIFCLFCRRSSLPITSPRQQHPMEYTKHSFISFIFHLFCLLNFHRTA